jgi:DNA polymerase
MNSEHVRKLLIDRLESLQQAGVRQLPRTVARAKSPISTIDAERRQPEIRLPPQDDSVVATMPQPTALPPMEQTRMKESAKIASVSAALIDESESPVVNQDLTHVTALEVLQPIVATCTRCGELASTRTQTVFGVGNPKARLCFLGEAPGADEDRLGEPFVGRAGQLLTKIIEACKLKREDVYILNMLKCRPPGNRNPLPTELTNCRGYLDRQLELIGPEFLCCCGAVAAQNLLNTTVSIGKLRGKIHDYRGIKVVCTYHPAFLLRSPGFKKETWEDMKFLMREMGTPVD